jgi:hypothetical protein
VLAHAKDIQWDKNEKADKGEKSDKGDKGGKGDRDDPRISTVPEANAGWVLWPFLGAVLFFSARHLIPRKRPNRRNVYERDALFWSCLRVGDSRWERTVLRNVLATNDWLVTTAGELTCHDRKTVKCRKNSSPLVPQFPGKCDTWVGRF